MITKKQEPNALRSIFENHSGHAILKWDHYIEIYERYFSRFRYSEVVILEIGIYQGGSLQIWKEYFGSKAKIYGIDIQPECKKFEDDQITIFIGSQSDTNFLSYLKKNIPKPDIILDDGGHMMHQQIISFENLFEYLKDDGVYLVEDLHTSYWKEYDGGYKRSNTFIEYSKELIDQLNAYHSRSSVLVPNQYTENIYSLHFFDSVLIVEKGLHREPVSIMKGTISIDNEKFRWGRLTIKKRLILMFRRLKLMIKRLCSSH